MNVSVEATVALPARLRPTPVQVCDWYERTLRSAGADVVRAGPEQLEFTEPSWDCELEVTDTSDGFEVSLRARPRLWLSYVALAALGLSGGALTFSSGPSWYLLALAGVGIAAWGWLGTRASLHRLLHDTNAAIADSFAAAPPPAHESDVGPPPTPSQGAVP